jgi:hypothetical protein
MELLPIEELLKKYDRGETSIAEEANIAAFFAQNDVPKHLLHYKTLFSYFSTEKHQDYKTDLKLNKRSHSFRNLSIAASVVILFGLALNYNSDSIEHYSEDEIFVYNQTKAALELLSNNLNKGTTQLKNLEVFSNAMQKGEQNITYLNTFNTTTNKIFKINK